MPVSKTCIVCSRPFSVPPSRAETATTCSNTCAYVVRGKAKTKEKVAVVCKHCGESFHVHGSQAKARVYCSRKCQEASLETKTRKSLLAGQANPAWKGGRVGHSQGYILTKANSHPFSVNGYVFEHRLVIEQWMREEAPDHPFLVEIGGTKYLKRELEVHHKNEVKADNRRENLVACTSGAHRDMHGGRPVMRGTAWPEMGNEIEFSDRRIQCKCERCGATFMLQRVLANRGQGKFCTRECYDKWRAPDSDLPPIVERKCIQCGAGFSVTRWKVAHDGGKFCSNQCRHKARIGVSNKHVFKYEEPTDH